MRFRDYQISQAADFARAKHAANGQTYDGKPYFVHLEAVSEVLRRFGHYGTKVHVVGFLHDTVEDTDTTKEEIAERFGEEIADLVWRVTDEPGLPNRKARHEATWPRTAEKEESIIVKLADVIANFEMCIRRNDRRIHMYHKEWPDFRAALYKPGVADEMWTWLDYLHARVPAEDKEWSKKSSAAKQGLG